MFIEGPLFGLRAARSIYKPPDDAVQRGNDVQAQNKGPRLAVSRLRDAAELSRGGSTTPTHGWRRSRVAAISPFVIRTPMARPTLGLNWDLNTNFRLMLDYRPIGVIRLNSSSEVSKEIA
jgi:hypothetical protein